MNILAVDDERIALEGLSSTIRQAIPGADVYSFRSGEDALLFAEEHEIQIAFLDIEMRGMNGLNVARQLIILQPHVNIIFTTGYSEYSGDAFDLHASGYIRKPVTERKILEELEVLRFPVTLPRKLLQIQCFGNFEVLYEGKPLRFQYNKTRELFAYLVSRRGAMCTIGEVAVILWPEDISDHNSYLKNLRLDLTNTFESIGQQNALVRQRGMLAVVPSEVECDYYKYLSDPEKYRHLYNGEFMAQYSWAEPNNGNLEGI